MKKRYLAWNKKNENLSDNLKRTKSEVKILNKDKKKITKEKESLQKRFENVSASLKLSKPEHPLITKCEQQLPEHHLPLPLS